jgi:hypothetical protein
VDSTTKLVPPAKSRQSRSVEDVFGGPMEATCQLVKLKSEGDGKEEELVANSDYKGYCEIVIV